jgi:hypothetical protein
MEFSKGGSVYEIWILRRMKGAVRKGSSLRLSM